jgi:general secretion pathway protein G
MKRWLKVPALFTLLLLTLGGVFAVFIYSKCLGPLRGAKEAVLRQNLWVMRRAAEFYANDKGRRPQSLDELVSAGYLREIPADPFTGSNKTWSIEREKGPSAPNTPTGVFDVHSGAAGADKNGKSYNRY